MIGATLLLAALAAGTGAQGAGGGLADDFARAAACERRGDLQCALSAFQGVVEATRSGEVRSVPFLAQ